MDVFMCTHQRGSKHPTQRQMNVRTMWTSRLASPPLVWCRVPSRWAMQMQVQTRPSPASSVFRA